MKILIVAIALALLTRNAHADDDAVRWNGTTTAAVLGGEAVGVVGLGLLGGLAGGALASSDSNGSDSPMSGLAAAFGAMFGGTIGAAIGLPVGAQVGGDLNGGSGKLLGTLAGAFVADALGAGIAYIAIDRDHPKIALLAIPIFFAGPWLGYELTSDTAPSTKAFVAPIIITTF